MGDRKCFVFSPSIIVLNLREEFQMLQHFAEFLTSKFDSKKFLLQCRVVPESVNHFYAMHFTKGTFSISKSRRKKVQTNFWTTLTSLT